VACRRLINQNHINFSQGETMKTTAATKKPGSKKSAARKGKEQRPYVKPKTAAELGITCLSLTDGKTCGAPVIWFDYELGEKEFYKGLVCDVHKVSSRLEKLAQPTAACVV
jgi:hypothetical protein